jgi:cytochrome P450
VGGVAVEEGALVTLCIGAANRDPAQFERPDVLDLARRTTGTWPSASASTSAPG